MVPFTFKPTRLCAKQNEIGFCRGCGNAANNSSNRIIVEKLVNPKFLISRRSTRQQLRKHSISSTCHEVCAIVKCLRPQWVEFVIAGPKSDQNECESFNCRNSRIRRDFIEANIVISSRQSSLSLVSQRTKSVRWSSLDKKVDSSHLRRSGLAHICKNNFSIPRHLLSDLMVKFKENAYKWRDFKHERFPGNRDNFKSSIAQDVNRGRDPRSS